MRYLLPLCFVVVNLYLRIYLDVLCVLILCCYRAASPVAMERQALCPSSGNIEVFQLLCQVQSQTDYKEVIPLFIIHLELLPGSLDHTFLLYHQKCVTELETLVLSSQKTHKVTQRASTTTDCTVVRWNLVLTLDMNFIFFMFM